MLRLLSIVIFSATMSASAQSLISKSNPEANFEAFWTKFEQKYAFFATRNIDWQKQYNIFRPQVTESTGKQELFSILSDMIQPLQDGHVSLSKKGESYCPGDGTLYFYREFNKRDIKELNRVTEQTLRSNGFDKPERLGPILRFSKSDRYGYLRITEFEGISSKKLEKKLDQLMVIFSDCEGVVIDIRANPGGYDSVAIDIANRFTDQRRIGYVKETQRSPGQFKPAKTFFIEPIRDQAFDIPIIILTNDATASAAEVFAMVMRQLPHVTIIGTRTEGIFSDMLESKLPNGWRYTLSHQVYRTPDGICYEDKGVPVDLEINNQQADLKSRNDPLITNSIELLHRSQDR